MRFILPVLLLSLVLPLIGCGSDANDDTDNKNTQTSEAAALAEVVCTRQAETCPGTDTKAACVEDITNALSPLFTLSGIEIDATALAACKQAIAALPADTVKAYAGKPPALLVCAPFTRGTLTNGAACAGSTLLESLFEDERCESGVCANGVCAAPAAENQTCDIGGCAAGLTCFQGTCIKVAAEGEDCSQMGFCADNLKCFDDGQGTMRCQTPRSIAVGETCATDGACVLGDSQCFCAADNLGCAIGVCGRVSYCKP
jgi:hypothetical protein